MPNLNMPVKFCTDENGNPYSPVVYQESMFNDDGTRMDPVPRKMFAKAYDHTKTYPTENLFCIQDNKYYKFTGSGTTTGTFDPTKWTETDDATELTQLNSTLTEKSIQSTNVTVTVGSNGVAPLNMNAGNYKILCAFTLDKIVIPFLVNGTPIQWWVQVCNFGTMTAVSSGTYTIGVRYVTYDR